MHHLYHIIVVLPSDPGRRGCRLSVAMADGSIGYFTTEVFQCQKKVACECGECVCGGDREGSVCMAVCGCSVCVCVCQGKRGFSTLQKLYVCLFLTPSFFHPHTHTHTHTHTHPHTHTPSHIHTYRPCQLQSTPPQCLDLVLSSVPAPSFPTLKKWQEMSVSHKFKHHFQITMETKVCLA